MLVGCSCFSQPPVHSLPGLHATPHLIYDLKQTQAAACVQAVYLSKLLGLTISSPGTCHQPQSAFPPLSISVAQPRSVDSWSSIKACFLPTCTLASEALSRRQKRSAVGTADHSRQGSTNPPQHHPQNPKMHEFRKVPASSKLYTGISGEARAQARERLFKINPYPCWLTGKPETITCIQISYQHKSH